MLNLDSYILRFDKGLRSLFAGAYSVRPHPDAEMIDGDLNADEKKNSAALMRVNHSGEICAQALYQGQSITAHDPKIQQMLNSAAQEETEHLAWTARRVNELGSHVSFLNPLWYTSSLAVGTLAGLLGDKWSLGFLAETERQVGAHLQSHLVKLPENDSKSRAVVQQMYLDETQHAEVAVALGGLGLPLPVRLAMRFGGKIMTRTSYWV